MEDNRVNRKRKEEEINWQRQPLRNPHQKNKGQLRASRLPCTVASGWAYPRATARATASEWRPYVPLGHGYPWTITDVRPRTQAV